MPIFRVVNATKNDNGPLVNEGRKKGGPKICTQVGSYLSGTELLRHLESETNISHMVVYFSP